MFPNLNAELSRKNVTLTDLAEAKAVKKFLQVDIPLEELFEERSEEAV